MKVKSESEVAQSFLALSDPMDFSQPGTSSTHGIFQARVLEWGAIAFSVAAVQITTNLVTWNNTAFLSYSSGGQKSKMSLTG